ncbi:MAG TPA: long-chain fatty acid--CoA ligase [Nitrospirales bacterium]|nr:long-chain fatty acid--CoA ligase [Nitrospirales bacterium]
MNDHIWFSQYEPHVPQNIDYPNWTIVRLLHESASQFPDRAAISFYGKPMTYRELDDASNRFAQALIGLGVKKDNRVAIMLPNIPQTVIAYYGILKTGARIVHVNPLYVERELEHQLSDSGSIVILALDLFYEKVQNVKPKTTLQSIIVTGIRDYLPTMLRLLYPIKAKKNKQWVDIKKVPPVYDFRQLLKSATPRPPDIESKPDDLALLQYTGGTTGVSKGVMLSHANVVANTLQCRYWMTSLEPGQEVFIGVLPYFHAYGMSTSQNLSISLAGTQVLLPRFQADEVLKAIEKHRATVFCGIQAMFIAINNHPRASRFDLSSLKVCMSGAGPLHAEVQKKFEDLTGATLIEGYGLTESAPVTHCNPCRGTRKKGSIGVPFPDTVARIVDIETGIGEVPLGNIGELTISGPQVMAGYWNKPEDTKNTIRDGWLYTGDSATMDEDGFFYIVDRKKDMIKSGGENVYPRELEEVLFRHPKIKDVVVVGLPHSLRDEAIKAYVVLKDGEHATDAEILKFCREHLAKFKVPRWVEFRTELPKNLVGKVLRRTLREEELAKKKR